MRELHLFAGAGGGILGSLLLGHTTVCAVEIEPYCRKVLLQRQRDGILPKFPIWDDVRTFDGSPWRGKVDVLCGGFPCKGISPARTNSATNGKLVGIEGGTSELWQEIPRIAEEVGFPDLFLENSVNLTNKGLCRIIQKLESLGYSLKWLPLGAVHVGADHERLRLWGYATHTNSPQLKGGKLSSRENQENPNACRPDLWEDQPRVERVAYGMANQVDRLKAIGNGQVPAVVKLAWETLTA